MKIVCINYSNTNTSLTYCPNKKNACDLFCEKTETTFDATVECPCGEFYCFFCRAEPHDPASCEDVIKWGKLLNNEEGTQQWIEKNTKACPSCKALVEKSIGCSKIKCLCGAEFCFTCNQKWDEIHRSNKGECTEMTKKENLQELTGASDFRKVLEWSMAITRTEKKNLSVL
jgi:hypothetical protein